MRLPPFTPQEDFWYSFLLEAESAPRAIVRLGGLGKLKNPPQLLIRYLRLQILNKILGYSETAYQLFINFEKAYN
jgi:hypothetical protein